MTLPIHESVFGWFILCRMRRGQPLWETALEAVGAVLVIAALVWFFVGIGH